jgi:hypothetical protein
MVKLHSIQKLLIVALFAMGIQVAYAAFSFTGLSDEKQKSNRFSLRNLSLLSHKSLTFSSLKSSLQFKGGQSFSASKEGATGMEINYMLRYDNGNTTYIYPYKFKIKAPKFKTPTPPQR